MRRNNNLMNNNTSKSDKVVFYVGIGVAIILILIISGLIYANGLENNKQDIIIFEKSSDETQAEKEETEIESANAEIGKTVEEVQEETLESEKEVDKNTTTDNNIVTENTQEEIIEQEQSVESTTQSQENQNNSVVQENRELSFEKPVEGEIMREFAKDNLVYSDTLEEWVTHLGIDIKADKTSVVNAAESGVVKSIKNDPRYGLTIVIDHGNNFETVYSNLLSSEFVVEGETVEKGQAIGTVGNSAPFEIADEPHLHFEILENSIQVDPMLYLK